jgi:hypothetical protein
LFVLTFLNDAHAAKSSESLCSGLFVSGLDADLLHAELPERWGGESTAHIA